MSSHNRPGQGSSNSPSHYGIIAYHQLRIIDSRFSECFVIDVPNYPFVIFRILKRISRARELLAHRHSLLAQASCYAGSRFHTKELSGRGGEFGEVRREPLIEVVSPAQMAMVNFRYSPEGMDETARDALNARFSRRMIESGYAGVFTTELQGKKVLRICAPHPEATEHDMRETVRRLTAICREEIRMNDTTNR